MIQNSFFKLPQMEYADEEIIRTFGYKWIDPRDISVTLSNQPTKQLCYLAQGGADYLAHARNTVMAWIAGVS